MFFLDDAALRFEGFGCPCFWTLLDLFSLPMDRVVESTLCVQPVLCLSAFAAWTPYATGLGAPNFERLQYILDLAAFKLKVTGQKDRAIPYVLWYHLASL